MGILESGKASAFLSGAVAFLRAEAPEVVEEASEEEISVLVRAGIAKAESHGIDDEYCIRQFLLYMAWCGPDFDQESWAREILDDRECAQSSRISRLEDHILSTQEGE